MQLMWSQTCRPCLLKQMQNVVHAYCVLSLYNEIITLAGCAAVTTSSAECYSLPSSVVCEQVLTIHNIVRRLPPGHLSVAARRSHFFLQDDAQSPWLVPT